MGAAGGVASDARGASEGEGVDLPERAQKCDKIYELP